MVTTWTEADFAKLERAIADGVGVRTISFETQSVTFSSIEEMLLLRSTMRQALDDAAGTTTAPRNHRFAVTSKGV